MRHLIANVLRNLAQRVDPQPAALTWTYHVPSGTTTVTHWREN